MKDFVLGVLIGAVEIFFENANSSLTDILIGCLIMFFANRKGKKQALKRPYRNQPFLCDLALIRTYINYIISSYCYQEWYSLLFLSVFFFICLSSCKVEKDYQQKAPAFYFVFYFRATVRRRYYCYENILNCY